MSRGFILVAGATLTLALAPMAFASGGGGGGGGDMPSQSAPSYDPAAEYVKGVQALNNNKFKEAERALGHVVEAVPRNGDAWTLLGVANAGQNDTKGAKRAFERAVKYAPDSILAHRGLGVALGGLKDPKAQAELDWLKAQAGTCGTCAQASDLQSAMDAVTAAMAGTTAQTDQLIFAGPKAGDGAYVTAVSLINEHRYDEALKSLAVAQTALGPHPDILTYQGYSWRKKGDLDRAEGYYRQALAIAPRHRGATEYYGELKVERGDLAGARLMLARLDRSCPYGCAEAETLRQWIELGHDPGR